jgi:hypothetical protein
LVNVSQYTNLFSAASYRQVRQKCLEPEYIIKRPGALNGFAHHPWLTCADSGHAANRTENVISTDQTRPVERIDPTYALKCSGILLQIRSRSCCLHHRAAFPARRRGRERWRSLKRETADRSRRGCEDQECGNRLPLASERASGFYDGSAEIYAAIFQTFTGSDLFTT